MSGQPAQVGQQVKYLPESQDVYDDHTPPPFTCNGAPNTRVWFLRDGEERKLRFEKYPLKSGDRDFATLELHSHIYIVMALPKDWKHGDAMISSDHCTDWLVWQGPRQQFIGSQFDGPIATSVGPGPSDRITVQPAQLKRARTVDTPIQSKRARTITSPSPDRTSFKRDQSSPSARTLIDTSMSATQAKIDVTSVARVKIEKQTAKPNFKKPVRPSKSISDPIIIDLSDETPQPEDRPFAHSTTLKMEKRVDPWLHIKSYSGEKTPIEMRLSEAPGTVNEAPTMQSFFEKMDAILRPYSDGIHIMEAVFLKFDSSADTSKCATKTLNRLKICREVKGSFDRFLDLVREHHKLFRLDRGYITLTVVETW